MEIKEVLRELTQCGGVSGQEQAAAEAAKKLFAPYGEVALDALGNVIVSRKGNRPENEEHIVLSAHLDEIGMLVRAIDDKGFVKVARVGGVDKRVALSSEVTIYGKEPVYGVVCSVPPHLTDATDRKKLPDINDISIDIGYSKEEAEKRISIGDAVIIQSKFDELLGGLVCTKALDDRAGVASLLYMLEQLQGKEVACNVTVVLSSREEVGAMGAQTAAFHCEATHGIAVDVSFSSFPGSEKGEHPNFGAGAMIGFAAVLSRAMSEELVAVAQENGIPYTREAMGGRGTGTDADVINRVRGGVVTGCVSIPLRNMHSPAEIVLPADIEAVGKLLSAYITRKWTR